MNFKKIFTDWQRRNVFGDMVYLGNEAGASDTTASRLVVLVRDDVLPPIHQGIQAAHAIIQLMSSGTTVDPRSYIILLSGGSSMNMLDRAIQVKREGHKGYVLYSDPGLIDIDLGHSLLSAVAFEPMSNNQVRKHFGDLKRAE